MRIDVLTLFPEMFAAPSQTSMLMKARSIGALDLHTIDIRDYAANRHRKVDDTPYGGGGGMILQPAPVVAAVEAALAAHPARRVLLTTPQGQVLTHAMAVALAQEPGLVIVCGHYEGIDDRVRATVVTDAVSIGDYVLTGGELPALVIIDALARFLPGVLGAEGAAHRDSHANGLLEGPHYTRPAVFRGLAVPPVLQQGDHEAMRAWRRAQALRATWRHRPDLLLSAPLDDADRAVLAQLADEDAAARARNPSR